MLTPEDMLFEVTDDNLITLQAAHTNAQNEKDRRANVLTISGSGTGKIENVKPKPLQLTHGMVAVICTVQGLNDLPPEYIKKALNENEHWRIPSVLSELQELGTTVSLDENGLVKEVAVCRPQEKE